MNCHLSTWVFYLHAVVVATAFCAPIVAVAVDFYVTACQFHQLSRPYLQQLVCFVFVFFLFLSYTLLVVVVVHEIYVCHIMS